MLTLFDYLPSQNGWKVRQLLHLLGLAYRTEIVSIFEGVGSNTFTSVGGYAGAVQGTGFSHDGRLLAISHYPTRVPGHVVAQVWNVDITRPRELDSVEVSGLAHEITGRLRAGAVSNGAE